MVGVDHTSGTDTKPESTDSQAPDSGYQPPPDRPGSPGQPSRAESRAAARAPAESGGESPQAEDRDESGTEKSDRPGAASGLEGQREPNDDPAALGRPLAESKARAQVEGDAREEASETARPEAAEAGADRELSEVGRGPRAESKAQAVEAGTTDGETSEADAPARAEAPAPPDERAAERAPEGVDQQVGWDAPGQEPRPGSDGAEPLPGTGEAGDGELGAERRPGSLGERPEQPGDGADGEPDAEDVPDTGQEADHDDPRPVLESGERPDETSGGNDDPGGNAEEQPESPAAEETETDRFAGLPTRADLDPAAAGELAREHGEPLSPVDEDQDLREPDPERDSDWKKMLRGLSNDTEDAIKTADSMSNATLKLTKHRPPTDFQSSTRDNSPQVRNLDHSADIPSAAMGAVAAVMVMYSLARGLRATGGKILRRNNDGSDR